MVSFKPTGQVKFKTFASSKYVKEVEQEDVLCTGSASVNYFNYFRKQFSIIL